MSSYVESNKGAKKLLIAQNAHGSYGGVAHCNADDESAEYIIEQLDKFDKMGHRVAYFSNSCYSGDLLRKKIIADHLEKKASDKLCIVTDSYFARKAFPLVGNGPSDDPSYQLQNIKSGESVETLFKRSQRGLISSALWTTSGLDLQLVGEEIATPTKILKSFQEISSYCPQTFTGSYTEACAFDDSSVSIEGGIALAAIQMVSVLDVKKSINDNFELFKKISPSDEKSACLDGLKNQIGEMLGSRKEASVLSLYVSIAGVVEKISAKCVASFSDENFKQNLAGHSFKTKDLARALEKSPQDFLMNSYAIGSWEINSAFKLEPLDYARERLKPELQKLKRSGFIDDKALSQAEKAYRLKKPRAVIADQDKASRLLSSLLERDQYCSNAITPAFAFALGCMYKAPESQLDKQRKAACQNFTFP